MLWHFINKVGDEQIVQISRRPLKIPDGRRVMFSKFCTENPQILDTTIKNL
jgi:hypothetical protein